MIPSFDSSGLLPQGIFWADWGELTERYGHTPWRSRLLIGLRSAIDSLKDAGCRTVYIDGSFVTGKENPNDFDACWESTGVDPEALDPVLLTFDSGRSAQKAKFMGELFPTEWTADPDGLTFLEFFQTDKDTGRAKGIIAIDLEALA